MDKGRRLERYKEERKGNCALPDLQAQEKAMGKTELKPCKVHWCLRDEPKKQYQLKPISGICLEEVGVPARGQAVINRTIKPKVGDLVWCNKDICTIGGYLKQVVSFENEEMVVTTRYKDHSKNFTFNVFEFYGVVEMIFDVMGGLCYRRTDNG